MSDPVIDANSAGYLNYRQLQNFAREYCLNDSTMGIQSTSSRSSLPIEAYSTYAANVAGSTGVFQANLNTEYSQNTNF